MPELLKVHKTFLFPPTRNKKKNKRLEGIRRKKQSKFLDKLLLMLGKGQKK